jgi:hypothetical protein
VWRFGIEFDHEARPLVQQRCQLLVATRNRPRVMADFVCDFAKPAFGFPHHRPVFK